ncbi:MAG: hypothetical protein ACRDT1_10850, partial [Micromonosporaceae bacterium]
VEVRFDRDPTWVVGEGLTDTPFHRFTGRLLENVRTMFRLPDPRTGGHLDVRVLPRERHGGMSWVPWVTWDGRGYTGYFVPRRLASALLETVPLNLVHQVVMDFGVLNAAAVDHPVPGGPNTTFPAGTLISSAGGWRTAGDYIADLPPLEPGHVPIVVLTRIGPERVPDLASELSHHAFVILPDQALYALDQAHPNLHRRWRVLWNGRQRTHHGDLSRLLRDIVKPVNPLRQLPRPGRTRSAGATPVEPLDAVVQLARGPAADPGIAELVRSIFRGLRPPDDSTVTRVRVPDNALVYRLNRDDPGGITVVPVTETSTRGVELPTRHLRRLDAGDHGAYWLVDVRAVRDGYALAPEGLNFVARPRPVPPGYEVSVEPSTRNVIGLSDFQRRALDAAGLRREPVPAQGDCLFDALLIVDFERIAQRLQEPGSGRRDSLRPALETLREVGIVPAVRNRAAGTPDRRISTALAAVVQGMRDHLADVMLEPAAYPDPDVVWVSGPGGVVHFFDLGPAERTKQLDRLRQPGAWYDTADNSIFDHAVPAAVREFAPGTAILDRHALSWPGLDTPDWPRLVDGPATLRGGAIVYNGLDHYDAVPAPSPSRAPSTRAPSYTSRVDGEPDHATPELASYPSRALRGIVDSVVREVPRRDDDCEDLLLAVRRRLYPVVHGGRAMDDTAIDTRRGREQVAATTGWPRPASLDHVFEAVNVGVGRSAFLRVQRSNRPGHALVLHHTWHGVFLLDPGNPDPNHRMTLVSEAARLSEHVDVLVDGAVAAQAVVTDAGGAELPGAFPVVAESDSQAQALFDPADPHVGAFGLPGRRSLARLLNALRRQRRGQPADPVVAEPSQQPEGSGSQLPAQQAQSSEPVQSSQ